MGVSVLHWKVVLAMTAAKRWMFCLLTVATLGVAVLQWTGHHPVERPATTERPLLPANMPYVV